MKSKNQHWPILKKMFFGFLAVLALVALLIAFELFKLYRQVNGYKYYWHSRVNEEVLPDSIYYVALGDSTSQGIGASSPEKGYVGLIADSIHARSGKPVHVINLGVTGAGVNDALEKQIPQLKQLNLPADAIITVEIGANDLGDLNEAKFRQDMDRFMSELPSQTVISDMPYFGEGRYRKLETNAQAASKIIHELAKTKNLKVAPLHDVTSNNSSIFNVTIDLFHPSNRGYRNWHEAFARTLNL